MSKPKHTGVMGQIDAKIEKRNKENKMKTINIDWAKTWTITKTLLFVVSISTAFYLGMQYNQGVNDKLHAEVKALTVQTASKE